MTDDRAVAQSQQPEMSPEVDRRRRRRAAEHRRCDSLESPLADVGADMGPGHRHGRSGDQERDVDGVR